VIEDPRSSTPGLGNVLWVQAAYGDRAAEIWKGLKPHVLTMTRGWSEAYGLFLDGQADMVLSYTTSPAYHAVAENDDKYAYAPFTEGFVPQVEVAGRTATSKQPELAQRFLQFVVSPEFQAIIPETNWMYPVVNPKGGLPPVFDAFRPGKALLFPSPEVAENSKAWIAEWLAAMSR
jgi:thiamine transport system substrate-binding protein